MQRKNLSTPKTRAKAPFRAHGCLVRTPGRLKGLVLKNTHQTLAAFTLWLDCVCDIVSLLQLIYSNTLKPHGGDEPMRGILKEKRLYFEIFYRRIETFWMISVLTSTSSFDSYGS